MTTKRGFLPREGLYIDPIVASLRKILHPLFTLPLLYFVQGGEFSSTVTFYQKLVQYIAATSTLLWVNNYLSVKSRNNWTIDNAWDWKKELVVVTGGSGGIGAGVAQRLAAMGARVVVVDIIPLTYKPGMVKLFLY
jgi:all-trans-retinol dehydrogenase (NAD+)